MGEERFTIMTEVKGMLLTEDRAREDCLRYARTGAGDATYYVVKVIAAYKKDPVTSSEIDLRITSNKEHT